MGNGGGERISGVQCMCIIPANAVRRAWQPWREKGFYREKQGGLQCVNLVVAHQRFEEGT